MKSSQVRLGWARLSWISCNFKFKRTLKLRFRSNADDANYNRFVRSFVSVFVVISSCWQFQGDVILIVMLLNMIATDLNFRNYFAASRITQNEVQSNPKTFNTQTLVESFCFVASFFFVGSFCCLCFVWFLIFGFDCSFFSCLSLAIDRRLIGQSINIDCSFNRSLTSWSWRYLERVWPHFVIN